MNDTRAISRFLLAITTMALLLAVLSGCGEGEPGGEEGSSVEQSAGLEGGGALEQTTAAADPREVGANEAGQIMVLEYHRVGGDPDFAPEWTISVEDFRGQLRYLHDNDYHPVNFRDLLEHELNVPAGKTPVVLTFDDSSDVQFQMVEQAGEWVPDPASAVGVLEEFSRENPDWPLRATFFVLPAAAEPNNLFGQPELDGEKLRYLVETGMEVGNHTLYHANLATYTDEQVQEQLARAEEEIARHIPDYEVVSLSVPFGEYPLNEDLLRAGSWQGLDYELKGAAEVAGGAAYAPTDTRFDPYHVPRIQAEPQKLDAPV